jgi:hypothetical protein
VEIDDAIKPVGPAHRGRIWTQHELYWFWACAWDVAVYAVMRKCKWLFVSGYECTSQIYSATEFLTHQDGACASMFGKLNVEEQRYFDNKWDTSNVVITSHLIFDLQGTLLVEHDKPTSTYVVTYHVSSQR